MDATGNFPQAIKVMSQRVLLVEDEALIALDMHDVLTSAGFDVVGPAGDVATASDLADRESLDCALLDVNLGGSLVWPVAQRLRDRGVPFVLLTGYGASLQIPTTFAGVRCLFKPVRSVELLRALREPLGPPANT